MFHPSPSDQKSGLVSSKKFHASFTTTSIPIPQGLGGQALKNLISVFMFARIIYSGDGLNLREWKNGRPNESNVE
jgi:hypothetical protein